MCAHNSYHLKINKEFYNLIPPLTGKEFKQLESNLKRHGCQTPIVVWDNTIIDGYDTYNICKNATIPFEVEHMQFDSKEAVILWICARQLNLRKMSEEYKRYLIGKMYWADRTIHERKITNTATADTTTPPISPQKKSREKLEQTYHLSFASIYRYGAFAAAVDEIASKHNDIAQIILSGKIKISHDTIVDISHLPAESIRKLKSLFMNPATTYIRYGDIRMELQWKKHPTPKKKTTDTVKAELPNTAEIKQMPQFDPDAELSSLTLTIPSWISSITRAFKATDLSKVTPLAAQKLQRQLLELSHTANQYLITITEKEHE